MSVRAKLCCVELTDFGCGRGRVVFEALYDESISEYQRFQKATPSGTVKLDIDNPHAIEQFRPGKNYYVDFTPAD